MVNAQLVDYDSMVIIVRLMEAHNFQLNAIKTMKPIKNRDFQQNIDETSYRVVGEFFKRQ